MIQKNLFFCLSIIVSVNLEASFRFFSTQKIKSIKIYPLETLKYRDVHDNAVSVLEKENPSDIDKIRALLSIQEDRILKKGLGFEEHGQTERIKKKLEPQNKIIRFFFKKIYKQKKEL